MSAKGKSNTGRATVSRTDLCRVRTDFYEIQRDNKNCKQFEHLNTFDLEQLITYLETEARRARNMLMRRRELQYRGN